MAGTASFALGLRGAIPEVAQPVVLPTAGKIPQWVSGALYRNGPGVFDLQTESGKTFSFTHWFDGLTVLHKFNISEGEVTYQNRHLNPEHEEYVKKHGYDNTITFGQDPCGTLFSRTISTFVRAVVPFASLPPVLNPETKQRANGNVGVTIGKFGGRLLSRTDGNTLVEVDPVDLLPKPAFSYTTLLPQAKGVLSAAHPQHDKAAGIMYNFTLDFPRNGGLYTIFGASEDPEASPSHLLARIPADPAYIHSAALTEHYFVLMLCPAVLNPLKILLDKNVLSALRWAPERGTLFYVVDRRPGGPGHVATYRSDAFFCFHTINAWEADGGIEIDLCRYDDMQVLHNLKRQAILDGAYVQAKICRYTLPSIGDAISKGRNAQQPATWRTLIDRRSYELARINSSRHMRPYRYVYATTGQPDRPFIMSGLAKVDVSSGEETLWQQEDCYPSEPIFLPRPGATAEDDGVLLSVVLSGKQQRSFLLVLNAADLSELGRAEVPQHVPFGFHGNFYGPDAFSAKA